MGIMKRRQRLAVIVLCACVGISLAGCSGSRGNAGDLLRVTPNPSASANLAYDSEPLTGCEPLPEQSGPTESDLRFQGPCTFTESQSVQCVNKTDDYYAYVNRQLPDYGQLSALINVEKYKGPGTYTKNSVVFLQVSRKGVLFEWKQESATLTVADNGNKVIVGASSLPPLAGGPARGAARVEGVLVCRQ
jgi:hypothetical protein